MLDKGEIANISQNLKDANNELKRLAEEYSYLNRSHKSLMYSIKSTINQVDSYYESNNELIHTFIQRSGNVKRAYEELNALIEEHKVKLQEADASMNTLSEQYGAPKERLAEIIKQITEIKNLEEEINVLKQNGADTDAKKSLYLNEQEKKLEKIKTDLEKNELSKSLLEDYQNQDEALKDVLETQKEVKETTKEVEVAQGRVTKEIEKGNERLQRWKKSGLTDFFGGLWSMVKKAATAAWDKMNEVDQAGRDFGRQMGMSTQELERHTDSLFNNYSKLAGKLGMEFKDMYKFQVQYAEVTEKATMLSMDQVGAMASVTRNVGEEAVSVAGKNLDVFATSADATIEYLAKGTARAAMEGLNVKKYSEAFAKNIKMASKYTFKEGITGIQKMTLLSQRLKFDMESIGSAMDKFSTIEGAIEASAKIQVLGGTFAQNFGNPLQAMAEALLDAEGFTKRIIDTVSSQARFNSKTGEIDLAPIDKQRLKAYAEALGISYDEVHNMATQTRKGKEIERVVGRGKFNEEELAYLSNKAQFDKDTGKWKIVGVDGETAVADISNLSADKLKEIRQTDSHEKMLNANLKEIKKTLLDQAEAQQSNIEIMTGKKESLLLNMAGTMNGLPDWMKEVIFWLVAIGGAVGLSAVAQTIGGIAKFAGGGYKMFGGGAKGAMGGGGAKPMHRGGKGGAKPAKLTRSQQAKLQPRDARGRFVKGAPKAAKPTGGGAKISGGSVAMGGAMAALNIGMSAYEVHTINKQLEAQEQEIYEAQATIEEKGQALNNARREANKSKGASIGAAAAGTAVGLGLMATGVGFLPGLLITTVASLAGGAIGSAVGDSVTESLDESMEDVKKNSKNTLEEGDLEETEEGNSKLLDFFNEIGGSVRGINTTVGEIQGLVSKIVNNIYADNEAALSLVKPNKNNGGISIKVEDIKINVDGQIRLTGNSKSVDIDEICDSKEFKDAVKNLIETKLKNVSVNESTSE